MKVVVLFRLYSLVHGFPYISCVLIVEKGDYSDSDFVLLAFFPSVGLPFVVLFHDFRRFLFVLV